METKVLYVTYTNSDNCEGRGYHIPIAVSETLSTGERLGKGNYVQGSNCPVNEAECIKVDNKWYIPLDCVNVIKASETDLANENKRIAIEKAKALGLSEADIKALLN